MKIFFLFLIHDICASTESFSLENQTFITKTNIKNSINENSKNLCKRKESIKNDYSYVEIELEDLGVSTEPSTLDNTKTIPLLMTDEIDNAITAEDCSSKKLKEKKSFCTFFMERGGTCWSILILALVICIVLTCIFIDALILVVIMVMLVAILLYVTVFLMCSEWKAEIKR